MKFGEFLTKYTKFKKTLFIDTCRKTLIDTKIYPHNEYIKDLCLYRLYKSHLSKKDYNNYIIINHVNGVIDKVNLNKIIHIKSSQQSFPAELNILKNTGV